MYTSLEIDSSLVSWMELHQGREDELDETEKLLLLKLSEYVQLADTLDHWSAKDKKQLERNATVIQNRNHDLMQMLEKLLLK